MRRIGRGSASDALIVEGGSGFFERWDLGKGRGGLDEETRLLASIVEKRRPRCFSLFSFSLSYFFSSGETTCGGTLFIESWLEPAGSQKNMGRSRVKAGPTVLSEEIINGRRSSGISTVVV